MATNTTRTTDESVSVVPDRPQPVPEGATYLGTDDAHRQHWATGPLPRGEVLVVSSDTTHLHKRLTLPVQQTETGTVIRTRPDWMAYVDARCGWDVRADETGLVNELAESLEGSA